MSLRSSLACPAAGWSLSFVQYRGLVLAWQGVGWTGVACLGADVASDPEPDKGEKADPPGIVGGRVASC